jgi:hypothetical protein
MSEEQRLIPTAARRGAAHAEPHSYFVGRRSSEAAEVYAVTVTNVERLRPRRGARAPSLDWHGSEGARMELSHLLISRAGGAHRPTCRHGLPSTSSAGSPARASCSTPRTCRAGYASRATPTSPRSRQVHDGPGSGGGVPASAVLPGRAPMAEHPAAVTSQHPDKDTPRTGPTRSTSRRSASRRYLAVVTAEARRLGRQLRPPAAILQRPRQD